MDTTTLLYGAFYGALGVMALYNALLFFRLREYTYLAYAGFIACILVLVLMSDHVILGHMVGETPLAGPAGVIGLAGFACALQFTRLFLNTSIVLPQWDRWLLRALTATGIAAILTLVAAERVLLLVQLVFVATFVLILATGIAGWKHHVQSAHYFVIAWAAVVVAACATLGVRMSGIESLFRVSMLMAYAGLVLLLVLLALGMADRIQGVMQQALQASGAILAQSQHLSSGATQLSSGSSKQAASMEEASASMQEMAANIRQNADNATQTEQMAHDAATTAETSGHAVMKTVQAMHSIARKISQIDDIAQQTRLLSLNATIEAAKAGETGKGFTVVASEVRNLSNSSREVAQEITDLVLSSLAIAEEAGGMLEQLVPKIRQTSELVQEISAATLEQRSGTDQINLAIQQLDQVTQQNSAMAEELASTAEALTEQAEGLQTSLIMARLGTQQPQSSRRSLPKRAQTGRPRQQETPQQNAVATRDEQDDDFERY